MKIWHWEMRPSVVKFKPIYLSGKLVEASLSLYSVRLKMTNAVGLKPWDEVWATKPFPKDSSWELLAVRITKSPMSGVCGQGAPQPWVLLSVHLKEQDNWPSYRPTLGLERREYSVEWSWNDPGLYFLVCRANPCFRELFSDIVNEQQKKTLCL